MNDKYVFPGDVWKYGCVDVSHHQGRFNYDQMMRKPIHAIGIRIGQGTFIDREFRNNWSYFRGKLPRFGYWFFEPITDPIKQADLMLSALGGDYGELPPFVDIEQNGDSNGKYNTTGKPYPAFPISVYWGKVMDFILRCDARFGARQMGIYSGQGFWDANVPSGMYSKKHLQSLSLARRLLWVSNYYAWGSLSAATRPRIPRDWMQRWDIWQFSADRPPNYKAREYGVLLSSSIDLNVFNAKTDDEFRRKFGFTPRIIMDVPTDVVYPVTIRTTAQIAVRSGPGEEKLRCAWADKGSLWTAYGSAKDTLGRSWYKVTPDTDIKNAKYMAAWLASTQ